MSLPSLKFENGSIGEKMAVLHRHLWWKWHWKSESGAPTFMKYNNLTDLTFDVIYILKGVYAYWTIKWSINFYFEIIRNIFNIFSYVKHTNLAKVFHIYLPCFVNQALNLSNLQYSASSVIVFSFDISVKWKFF